MQQNVYIDAQGTDIPKRTVAYAIRSCHTTSTLSCGYVAVMQITLVNITTTSTAEEVVTKFNVLIADLKAKDYMEVDTTQ